MPSTRISKKMTIETITRHIGKYEKSILDMVNAASGESDEEDEDDPIGQGSATRGKEDKSRDKEKFSMNSVVSFERNSNICRTLSFSKAKYS